MAPKDKTSRGEAPRLDPREARLAKALRENLRRRKAAGDRPEAQQADPDKPR